MRTSAPSIRPAHLRDAQEIADRLRQPDCTEIMLGGKEPREALIRAFELSDECFVVCDDYGFAVAIGGIVCGTDRASPWLMAAQGLSLRHIRFLIGHARDTMLPAWAKLYGPLYNHIWLGNKAHIDWCLAVGFTPGDTFILNDALYLPVTYIHV